MISHVTIGTNDIQRAKAFYGPLFEVLGGGQFMEGERSVAYGRSMDEPMVVVTTPFDGEPASVGNGSMVGLRCADEDQARAVYDRAMELGAKSEGEVGPRGDQGQFFGGYFRDPDGNKLAAFTMTAPKD